MSIQIAARLEADIRAIATLFYALPDDELKTGIRPLVSQIEAYMIAHWSEDIHGHMYCRFCGHIQKFGIHTHGSDCWIITRSKS